MRIEPWWRFFFFGLSPSRFLVWCAKRKPPSQAQYVITMLLFYVYLIEVLVLICIDPSLDWKSAQCVEMIGHLCGNYVKDFCRNERFALNSYAVFLSGRDKPFTENNCKYEATKFLSYLFHSLFHGVWLLNWIFQICPSRRVSEMYHKCVGLTASCWKNRKFVGLRKDNSCEGTRMFFPRQQPQLMTSSIQKWQ